jgi:hypothetical protein
MADNFVLTRQDYELLKRELGHVRREYTNLRNSLSSFGMRRHQAVYMPGNEPVKFRNDYAGEVPAYAVMRVTGTAEVGGKVIPTIDQPNTDFGRLYLVNGKKAVADDGYGVGTWLWDADWVLYDDTDTPAVGESWGPQNGSWELKKYRYGFTIMGGATGGSTDRVKASQHWVNGFIGKTDASHAKSATGTISVYDGNRVDTSINVSSVYNLFAAVATTKFVDVEWRGGQWYLTSAEC